MRKQRIHLILMVILHRVLAVPSHCWRRERTNLQSMYCISGRERQSETHKHFHCNILHFWFPGSESWICCCWTVVEYLCWHTSGQCFYSFVSSNDHLNIWSANLRTNNRLTGLEVLGGRTWICPTRAKILKNRVFLILFPAFLGEFLCIEPVLVLFNRFGCGIR